MIELNVKFKKKLFGEEDGDFSVFSAEPATLKDARLVNANKYGSFTISGDYYIEKNEFSRTFKVSIEEDYSSSYPNSYKMIRIHYEFPTDPQEQWKYLEDSGLVSLLTFREIRKAFSHSTLILDLICDSPEKLEEVKGLGPERAAGLQQKLIENKDKAVLFGKYGKIEGVGSKLINLLYFWKPSVEDVVDSLEENPFSIIQGLGVGFVVADRFRSFYKIPMNDRNRILHGVRYYLNEHFASTGNTYEEILEVSKIIAQKLNVSYREVIDLLAEIKSNEAEQKEFAIKIIGQYITTDTLFVSELIIYKNILHMVKEKSNIVKPEKWAKIKEDYVSKMTATLSDEQGMFLDIINNERVSVLLGPGGAGKSWVIQIACDLLKKAGKTFGLFAPTARAAKVMSDYTGTNASTIHRGLMKYSLVNEIAPYDVLIVDEFSMVDSELASVIMKVMGTKTRLIIVGDDYQLQSVGPGNVLLDLVQNLNVPTVRLTKIFRQASEHGLLDYAQALRDGTFNLPSGVPVIEDNNIVFINETDDARKQEIALKLYKESLDALDNNYEDIMLLTPSNKGPSGRRNMNKKIQDIVNKSDGKNEVILGAAGGEDKKRCYRKNDYITITSNQYGMLTDTNKEIDIINGDLGYITRVNPEGITFQIEKESYTIEKSSISGLIDHSWAITIHKSQGGQASHVVIVVPENASFMLNSNMIYTAITRTKVKCYVIGNLEALNKAGKRQANLTRKTLIQLQSSFDRR